MSFNIHESPNHYVYFIPFIVIIVVIKHKTTHVTLNLSYDIFSKALLSVLKNLCYMEDSISYLLMRFVFNIK